jgi:hypothetical protein
MKGFAWLALALLGVYTLVLSARLSAERDFRSALQLELEAPNSERVTLLTYVTALGRENVANKAALRAIDRETAAAKEKSDAADAELDRVQRDNLKKFEAVSNKLDQLMSRKSTGDAAQDCAIIVEDTKSAWQGWRQ